MGLDDRTRELIAIGASITANCQPCLQYHISKAHEYELNDQEITEAVNIGKMVRRGAAYKMDKFASSLTPAVLSAVGASNQGCGCD